MEQFLHFFFWQCNMSRNVFIPHRCTPTEHSPSMCEKIFSHLIQYTGHKVHSLAKTQPGFTLTGKSTCITLVIEKNDTSTCQKFKYPSCISLSFSSSKLFTPAGGPSQEDPCESVSSELQSSFQRSTGPLGSMRLWVWVCLCVRAETADGCSLWRCCRLKQPLRSTPL